MKVAEARLLPLEPSAHRYTEIHRFGVITIINSVVARMVMEVGQQEREVLEDLAILQTGIEHVMYGGNIVTLKFPALKARVWLLKGGRQLGVDEGLPSDPILRQIGREKARYPLDLDRIARLNYQGAVIQGVSFSFMDLHRKEYGDRWDERVDQEAGRIFLHPWRSTGSSQGDREAAERDLMRRYEIVV